MVTEADSPSIAFNGVQMPTKRIVQLFDSIKMYLFLFCLLALTAVEKIRQLILGTIRARTDRFEVRDLLLTCLTLFMAAYLPILFRSISNGIEQVGIVLTEGLCVLWLANQSAKMGITWAGIPHAAFVSTTLHCALAALAGVRVLQSLRQGKLAKEA